MTEPFDPERNPISAVDTEVPQTRPSPDLIQADPELPPDVQTIAPTRSLGADVWDYLRRNPLFWVSAALIVLFVVMAAFPQLFTSKDPFFCDLNLARQAPGEDAIFGYDIQGCDVYARTIHGARASILVGVLTAVVTAVLGSALGTIGGYVGRWIDTVLSRTADIFFAIPLLLGGIVILYSWKSDVNDPYLLHVGKVVIALAVLGWPNIYRLMRSSVLQTRPLEYVQAARALGANSWRVVSSHIIPNSMAPVIVVSTIDLGAYIATEATLSFLGIGLPSTIISWGQAISNASGLGFVRSAPHMLLFPSIFLSLTVLSFIMLGEVVRDAMDPKLR